MTVTAAPTDSTHLVFDRTDELGTAAHEQVVFCRDEATGLRAIIAIHDTRPGPALGGTRFHPYASEAEALTDVPRHSLGMTQEAAAAEDAAELASVLQGQPQHPDQFSCPH